MSLSFLIHPGPHILERILGTCRHLIYADSLNSYRKSTNVLGNYPNGMGGMVMESVCMESEILENEIPCNMGLYL